MHHRHKDLVSYQKKVAKGCSLIFSSGWANQLQEQSLRSALSPGHQSKAGQCCLDEVLQKMGIEAAQAVCPGGRVYTACKLHPKSLRNPQYFYVCLHSGYLRFTQFGSLYRKSEAWEWFRLRPSHALPPSLSHLDMNGSQRVSTSLATVCQNYLVGLHSPDLSPCPNAKLHNMATPWMFHPKNPWMGHSTTGPPEEYSGLTWVKGFGTWGHVFSAQETCTLWDTGQA